MEPGARPGAGVPRETALSSGGTAAELEALIEAGLAELRLRSLPPEAPALLARLSELVWRWSQRMNLTGHRSAEAVARRLVLDAAALSGVLPSAHSVADLGSGAGFPGLPLALLRPGSRVTLVESRERRHHFQREAVRTLRIGNVRPVLGRAESLEAWPHDLVLAQAMARPSAALRLMTAWARAGGVVALPGGPEPADLEVPPGIHPIAVETYRVPLGGPQRSVWLGRWQPRNAGRQAAGCGTH